MMTWSDYRPRRKALLIQMDRLERENAQLRKEIEALTIDVQFGLILMQDELDNGS